jgi:hypothetical protein
LPSAIASLWVVLSLSACICGRCRNKTTIKRAERDSSISAFVPRSTSKLYEQAVAAAKKHHDTRRHLFLNFLRESFNVDPVEVELERKIKVGD